MDAAMQRCYRAVPVRTLDEVVRMAQASEDGRVALRCTLADCAQCQAFRASGGRDAFEATLGTRAIVDWPCDDDAPRTIAMNAGVGDLPAYLVVASDRSTRVLVP